MHRALPSVLLLIAAMAATPAQAADPYRWCAHYGSEDGGGNNCYFRTLEQCRWAISGNGGMCTPNTFYTGTPAEGPRRRAKRRT